MKTALSLEPVGLRPGNRRFFTPEAECRRRHAHAARGCPAQIGPHPSCPRRHQCRQHQGRGRSGRPDRCAGRQCRIGMSGAFEATPIDIAAQVFETNTPASCHDPGGDPVRARRSGTLSMSPAPLAPMPLVAIYTASKMAIDGFTASLANELNHFGIRVRGPPGYGPTTAFSRDAASRIKRFIPEACAGYAGEIFAEMTRRRTPPVPEDVAEVVWQIAHDDTATISFPAGPDAVALSRRAMLWLPSSAAMFAAPANIVPCGRAHCCLRRAAARLGSV